jgi:hypothetical protein
MSRSYTAQFKELSLLAMIFSPSEVFLRAGSVNPLAFANSPAF